MNERLERAVEPRAMVKSADRALDLLEFVTGAREAPTFTRIARELELPKSSLSQLLGTLVARRYLDLDPTSATYRPGEQLLVLVGRASQSIPLRTLVMPVLERLRDEINETAGYYAAAGDEIELVAAATSRQALVFIMNAGERAPLYAISPGKILLADMAPAQRDAWFERNRLVRFTERTIVSRDVLERELEEVQRTGFAYSDAEFARGIQGIACAVRVDSRLVGSINVSIPEVRFDAKLREAAHDALGRAAREMSRAVAGRITAAT